MGHNIAIYTRGDNSTDPTDRLQTCIEYARDTLGQDIPDNFASPPYNTDDDLYNATGIAWGADTQGTYPETLEDIINHGRHERINHLIIHDLHRLSDSLRDCHDIIDTLHAGGVTVHVADRLVAIQPNDHDLRGTLHAAAETERLENSRKLNADTCGEKHTGGRPPVGYTVENGRLRPSEDYDKVETVLQNVVNGKTSIHRAAAKLNVSRTTIRNAIDARSEMYGLSADAERPSRA